MTDRVELDARLLKSTEEQIQELERQHDALDVCYNSFYSRLVSLASH